MKNSKSFAALLVGLALSTFAQMPASAASPVTSAFLANVGVNVDFLDRSSRIALDQSDVAGVRVFARAEAQEAAKVASALGDVMPRDRAAKLAFSAGPDEIVTGRSVAIDGSAATPAAVDVAANGRAPVGRADLARLRGVTGRAFDDLYWNLQLDALSQLESDYRTYIANGDDAALVALSRRELPKIMNRLMALTKI